MTHVFHPHQDENGRDVIIHNPHTPTPKEHWDAAGDHVTTFVPGGESPYKSAPNASPETNSRVRPISEFKLHPKTRAAAGAIVLEPHPTKEGVYTHAWVVSPTNGFGPSTNTFAKGTHEAGVPDMQHTAVKEHQEETGMTPHIFDHIGDFHREPGQAWAQTIRFYAAHRGAGSPSDMGWESQAVHKVPLHKLVDFVDENDKDIARAVVSKYGDHATKTQVSPNGGLAETVRYILTTHRRK